MIVVYKNWKRFKEYKWKYLKNIKEQYSICKEIWLPPIWLYQLQKIWFIFQWH